MPTTTGRQRISLDFTKLEFIAAGKSGMVYGTDDGRVLKQYYEQESSDVLVEREVLTRLGLHPNIVRYLGATDNGYAVLERGKSLRLVLQQREANIPLDQKFHWVKEAALGLQHLHKNNILHADVGCHNMILIQDHVKLIDFEGCSIDGSEATSCYEWFSYRKNTPAISIKTDIFAYGCAVYEIIAGQSPYYELATKENRAPKDLVESLYASNQFPDITNLPLGRTIRSCWTETFDSMDEVIVALEADYASLPSSKLGNKGIIVGVYSTMVAGVGGFKAFFGWLKAMVLVNICRAYTFGRASIARR